ncbi:MAG: alpha-galactosidase [Thermaceae bacterium]|nr:alpha-galactosidase [Thermaceae bacterium]
MTARPKITLIGAGSAVFARQIVTDILSIEGLPAGRFALVDLDPERLELAHRITERVIQLKGRDWEVQASTERKEVLAGSDFVINTIEVGGLENVRHDYEIPLKYGVDQCIGDTIGPGGIFKALRTGAAWLEILRDIERLCPHAVVMNYTNPMSILTLVGLEATRLQVVGLCHSVQGSSQQLAEYLQVPYEQLDWRCAGINHNAWFTRLEVGGVDQYPILLERIQDPALYERDPIRFEWVKHFGAYPTESSGHFSEYSPYFRKRPDLIARYTRAGYLGESGFYANHWPQWRKESDEYIRAMLDGREEIPLERSPEYAADIVEAKMLNQAKVIYGNVFNHGLIDNLGPGCVEVPCLVDRKGLQPTHFGPLPEHLAAHNRAHMAVHALMVQAILGKNRQAAKYALMLDPLTAAVCSPAEIDALFEEMWAAEAGFLGAYA